jgi:ABC-type multidrug transport system fused ATPase/permease subunit
MKKYMYKEIHGNIVIIIMLFVISLLSVLTAVLLTFATNAILSGDLAAFIKWILIDLVVWIVMLALNYIETIYEQKIIQRMCTQIRVEFASDLEYVNYQAFHKLGDGQYISWMTNDLNTIENVGFKNVYAYISSLFSIILASIALVNYHSVLLLLTIILSLIMLFAPNTFTKYIKKATMKLSKANERLTSKTKDFIGGFDVLYFAKKRYQFRAKFLDISNDYSNEKVNYAKANAVLTNSIGLLNIFCQMLIDVATGILVIFKQVTFGAISTTGNLASTIFNSLAQLSRQKMQIKSAHAIFEKINDFSKIRESNMQTNQLQSVNQIELKNVSYSYDNKEVLHNVSMSFKKGGKYAVIGESGSGKSTLLKIMSGQIKNFDGEVFINDYHIKELNLNDLTTFIQYVDQSVYIFQDSIRNNITLWDEYSDEQIAASLERAQVNFVNDVDTVMEENGRNLSGGQRQRIALARSFIQEKQVLLIDEGTSSLDKKSAQLIEDMLRNDPTLTVVMVTHRLDPADYDLFDHVYQLPSLDSETKEVEID